MSRTSRPLSATLLAAVATTALAIAPTAWAAKRASRGKKPAKTAPARAVPEKTVEAPPAARTKTEPAPATTTASATPAKPRIYTFGGLDVNGNLRAPQLLFFRGRVKQELDTSSPEKRSFLKELEKTADAPGL